MSCVWINHQEIFSRLFFFCEMNVYKGIICYEFTGFCVLQTHVLSETRVISVLKAEARQVECFPKSFGCVSGIHRVKSS